MEMIRFRKLGPMLDIAEDFVRGFHRDQGDRMYSLLVNASSATDTYPTTGTTSLDNNILSINQTAFNIMNAVKDTRNLPITTPLVAYITPDARSSVMRAMGELSQGFSGSTERVTFNVQFMYTFNDNMPSATTGQDFAGIMVLPGHKIQYATLTDRPLMFNDTDILSLSFIQTAFAYYGAGVLDTSQIRTFEIIRF